MSYPSNWDDQHRKEVWDLITDASKILGIPLCPTISTAINYIHKYFETSHKLDLSLFQIALLATFVSSKTQETFCKADNAIDAFVNVGLQRTPDQLSILGTDIESLNKIKRQDTEIYEDFRKMFLDSELDFMTSLKWNFPDHVPFYTLTKWIKELKEEIDNENFNSISSQLDSSASEVLCNLILYPDSININVEDLAAAALAFCWKQFNIQTKWYTIVGYNIENEAFESLLNRLDESQEDE